MLNKLIMQLLGTNPIVTASAKTYQPVVELSVEDTERLELDLCRYGYDLTFIESAVLYSLPDRTSLDVILINNRSTYGYHVTIARIVPHE